MTNCIFCTYIIPQKSYISFRVLVMWFVQLFFIITILPPSLLTMNSYYTEKTRIINVSLSLSVYKRFLLTCRVEAGVIKQHCGLGMYLFNLSYFTFNTPHHYPLPLYLFLQAHTFHGFSLLSLHCGY